MPHTLTPALSGRVHECRLLFMLSTDNTLLAPGLLGVVAMAPCVAVMRRAEVCRDLDAAVGAFALEGCWAWKPLLDGREVRGLGFETLPMMLIHAYMNNSDYAVPRLCQTMPAPDGLRVALIASASPLLPPCWLPSRRPHAPGSARSHAKGNW